jgi:nucleoside-diphosphate-sugar epimerase
MSSGAILITGAAGFIGSALARRLTAVGERIVGLDLVPADDALFPCVVNDVRDIEAIHDLCNVFDVDRIVHAGGISGRSVERRDKNAPIAVNVTGTASIFEAARRHAVRRVVLCSSGSVYGSSDRDPVTEDSPLIPVNSYGASKVASEAIMHAYAAESGVDGVALRIFQAYGPFRRTRCSIRTMVEAALDGQVATIAYRENARCQYIYIDDVVEALSAALYAGPTPQRVYNVSGGTSLTLREVANIAAKILPGVSVQFGDDPLSWEYSLKQIDISAAKRDLGYVPKVGLAQGIAAYVSRVRAR